MYRKSYFIVAIIFLLISAGICQAQMSGTYSINSGASASASNYLTVKDAISDLMSGTRTDGGTVNGPGVSGPVTLRIAAGSGPYTEQVSIGAIAGTNATNTVRLTGGPSMETITFANTTTTDRHVIRLTGTKNIILDSLTLINTGVTYGYGVWITNNSDSNYVQNSAIYVDSTTTSSNFVGVTISATTPTTAGNNGDYNTIQNNIITGGYYGVTVIGTSTTVYGQQNHVMNNEIKSFYYYGLRHYEQNQAVISGNTIHARATGTTSAYGMYIYYNKDFVINANRIYDVGTYRMYFAYTNYLGSVVGGTGTITNNMIGGTNLNTGATYGIYMTTQSNNNNVYNNSVSIVAGDGRCIYIVSGSGNNIRNNSFSVINSGAGYAAYVSSAAYINSMDYNNYYAPGSSNFIYITAAYTQGTYVGGGGFNTNSIDGDPNYYDPYSNLHVFAAQLYDKGDNSVGVPFDYDGDPRPHPSSALLDIGADEYLPDSVDISTVGILDPENNICPDSNQVVSVIINNKGLNTLSNIPVTVEVTGFVTATLTVTHPGPIALGETDTVYVGTINTWSGGTLNLTAYTALSGDQSVDNDTLVDSRDINLTPAAPTASGDTLCEGDSTLLIANSTGTNFWYDAQSGGTLLGSGDTLNTGAVTGNTSYYVEARGLNNSTLTTTFANNNSCGGGNMFEVTAYNEITIDSFDLNLSAGTVNVDVYYKVGGFTGFETNAAAWTLLGSGSATSTGTGVPTRLSVGGLTIPSGMTYSIYVYTTSMVYTTLGAPTNYSNADLNILCGVGLCGLFSGTNNPRGWNGTVYYTAIGCASARTEVPVYALPSPTVSLTDSTYCGSAMLDAGNGGMGAIYNWTTGDTTQMATISVTGQYGVTVTLGSCSNTDSAMITINPLPVVDLGPDATLCAGNIDTLDAGFTAGATYMWNTSDSTQSIVVTTGGTYYVDVMDTLGCANSDTIVVTDNTMPSGGISIDTTACPDIVFTGIVNGGNPDSYSWDFGDGNQGSGASSSHSYTANGTYNVTLIQDNDCGSDTVIVPIVITCVVSTQPGFDSEISMYPNPTRDKVMISMDVQSDPNVVIQLTDLQGKIISSNRKDLVSGHNATEIDLGNVSAGMYFVRIVSDEFNWQGRLIKE